VWLNRLTQQGSADQGQVPRHGVQVKLAQNLESQSRPSDDSFDIGGSKESSGLNGVYEINKQDQKGIPFAPDGRA